MEVETCNPSIELVPFFKGLIITIISTGILKNIIKAPPRPDYPTIKDNTTYPEGTFPSGHSSFIMYIGFYIWLSKPCISTFLLLCLLWYFVAYKRYLDGYHRLSEVFGGTILGFVIAYYSIKV